VAIVATAARIGEHDDFRFNVDAAVPIRGAGAEAAGKTVRLAKNK
jgi:hypothetical protein